MGNKGPKKPKRTVRGSLDQKDLFKTKAEPNPITGNFATAARPDVRDFVQLSPQMWAIWVVVMDGRWRTLDEIRLAVKEALGVSMMQTSISTRLRDFRKERWGVHVMEKHDRGKGLFEYRVIQRPGTTVRELGKGRKA